jgi:hypothetical protein
VALDLLQSNEPYSLRDLPCHLLPKVQVGSQTVVVDFEKYRLHAHREKLRMEFKLDHTEKYTIADLLSCSQRTENCRTYPVCMQGGLQ